MLQLLIVHQLSTRQPEQSAGKRSQSGPLRTRSEVNPQPHLANGCDHVCFANRHKEERMLWMLQRMHTCILSSWLQILSAARLLLLTHTEWGEGERGGNIRAFQGKRMEGWMLKYSHRIHSPHRSHTSSITPDACLGAT